MKKDNSCGRGGRGCFRLRVNGSRLITERDEREGIKVAHFIPIQVVHLFPIRLDN